MNRSGLWIILAALIVCTAVAQEQALAPPDWETLRAVYDYDPSAPLEVQHGESSDAGAFTAEQFSFLGADGERVPALLLRPKNVPRPPVALFLHGLGGDKDQARLAAMLLAPRGIAVMAIVPLSPPLCSERLLTTGARSTTFILGTTSMQSGSPLLVPVWARSSAPLRRL